MEGPIRNQTRPRDVVPGQGPIGGGSRQKVQTEQLLVVLPGPTGGSTDTCSFDVFVPSSRLALLVAVTFIPDGFEDVALPTGVGAWNLTLDAWIQLARQQGGSWTRANQIIPATPIPTSQEVSTTLVKKWRGTVTLPFPAGGQPGKVYVTAVWEPAPGESTMPDSELTHLFGTCQVIVLQGGVTVVETE